MLKSSKSESDKIKELGLTMKELIEIARKIGVKNYEHLSRIKLVKEIDKLEPPKESKKKKITSSLLLKGKKNIGFKPKKKKKKSKKEPVKISKKIKFEKYKGDDVELKGKDIRKSFRLKKEKKDILGKKRGIEKFRSKKGNKKIAEIKDILKSPLLNKREKIKKIEKIITIKRYNVYRPVKVYEAFDGNFIEYQSKGDRDKSVSIVRYLKIIKEHLRKLIDSKKENGEWKIQLNMKINFISSRNFIESRDMYSKSNNIEIMMESNTNEIIKNLFNSLFRRYHEGLQVSMRGSEFVFDYVESLNYIFHKVDLKRSGSYIETPEWIQNKGATMNCQNDDDKCFQYAITIALNYDEIGNHHQGVNKVHPFIDQCNGKDINFPSHVDGWKKFELNNKSIALNVLYVPKGEKDMLINQNII